LKDLSRRVVGQETNSPWAISARLHHEDELKIGTGQVPDAPNRRLIRINEGNASGTDLAKLMTLNWLTPAQDRLFTGPESDRRKFLDRLCLVYFTDHGRTSIAYEKSRAERNRLLSDGIDDDYWFDALESDLAERGAHIAKARWHTLQKLKEEIEARPETVFPKAIIALNGEAEVLYEAGAEEIDVNEFIKDALQKDRRIDQRAGRTLRGVHKTALVVTHQEKTMPAADCSTGEQKALLIGLVLAHANSQKKLSATGQAPLLLLDEVAAHLDEHRRAALIEELLELDTQVFLTGTDLDLFSAFNGRAQVFKVENGELVPQ
jgi:DNA replication and repair protein RecF